MRMRKLQWLLILAVVSACDDDDEEERFDGGVEFPPPVTMEEWRANIVAIVSNSWITGEAVVRQTIVAEQEQQEDEDFTATITIRMDVPGAVRPWHVHFGTCATGGDIVGTDAEYPPLTVASDGTATSSATVPFTLDPAAPYHVNVHESEAAFNTIIACGDLILQ